MKATPLHTTPKNTLNRAKALIKTAINLLIMPIGACSIYTLINYYEKHKQSLNSTAWLILLIVGFLILLFAFNTKPKSEHNH
jgi:formate hydrogenlyase subunit 4